MAKMKLKTHSGAKKRFKLTKNGKIKRGHAFRSHILTKKTTKLTRGYRQPNYVDKTNAATIKSMLPLASFSIFLRRLWVMVAPLIRAIFYISFSCLNRMCLPAARS